MCRINKYSTAPVSCLLDSGVEGSGVYGKADMGSGHPELLFPHMEMKAAAPSWKGSQHRRQNTEAPHSRPDPKDLPPLLTVAMEQQQTVWHIPAHSVQSSLLLVILQGISGKHWPNNQMHSLNLSFSAPTCKWLLNFPLPGCQSTWSVKYVFCFCNASEDVLPANNRVRTVCALEVNNGGFHHTFKKRKNFLFKEIQFVSPSRTYCLFYICLLWR